MKKSTENNFNKLLPDFKRLELGLTSAIKQFISDEKIHTLAVTSRVKEYESFIEKVERKGYAKPFQDNEDFVGIRIILYYQSDVKKVGKIIDSEFDIQTSENKSEIMKPDQFGYRSTHKIIKVPHEWSCTPNFKGLTDIKCEIQIRTLLMHAWAEVEHKLQYKNEAAIPSEFKRTLFRLSAKFEEADEQFQNLRDGVESYQEKLSKTVEDQSISSLNNLEINTDTLKKYAQENYKGPYNQDGAKLYSGMVRELLGSGYKTIGEMDIPLKRTQAAFIKYNLNTDVRSGCFRETAWIRISMGIADKNYHKVAFPDSNKTMRLKEYTDLVSKVTPDDFSQLDAFLEENKIENNSEQ